jgi:hypothetical protein
MKLQTHLLSYGNSLESFQHKIQYRIHKQSYIQLTLLKVQEPLCDKGHYFN